MEHQHLRIFRCLRAIVQVHARRSTYKSNLSLQRPIGQPYGYRAFVSSANLAAQSNSDEGAKGPIAKEPRASESKLDDAIVQEKKKQSRAPWHREGSSVPPVARRRSAGAMTKGKLLTTPSRLLKLIIPLTTLDKNSDRKDFEPLALLVHPQQPLSYLERLIQSELPSIKNENGDEKIPNVHFKAEDYNQDEIQPKAKAAADEGKQTGTKEHEEADPEGFEATKKTGKLQSKDNDSSSQVLGDGGVESYSGLGREGSTTDIKERRFIRWSPSTETGDFIRDAARGKEFLVEIEGATKEIRIAVPSFNDRTYYLRTRLRKTSSEILRMAEVKRECDIAAHKGAQRIAMGGAGLLVGYWYIVYRLTFETELGWDTMEPVTYLVGLSTLICGYLWFLYHNREVSYRSALNLTISRRQTKLYQSKGFDLQRWESLIEEGNALRKEIKAVAAEYDVDWDEMVDEKDETVTEALEEVRNKKKGKKNKEKKNDADEDDE